MRKIILIILCFCAISVSAQTAKQDTTFKKAKKFTFTDVKSFTDGFRFGLHLSPTIGSLATEGQNLNSNGTITSVAFGIMFDKYLFNQERYALTTGLSIVNKGGDYTNFEEFRFPDAFPQDTFQANPLTLNLRYWEIPVALRLRSNPIKEKFIAYGQAGFIVGIRTRAEGSIASYEDAKFIDETKLFNFALSFGAGVEYKLGAKSHLMAGLVVSNGGTDILKNIDGIKANHVALQIGLFY